MLDRGAEEIEDTTLEFAALLVDGTTVAWAVLLAQTEDSSDVIAVERPAEGAVVLTTAMVELLDMILACDDVVE